MINNTPSLDLVEFIETQILPRYAAFDRAHNMEHVTRVIRSSLELSRLTGADINMVYTIAAYHDLGMSGHRADHHIRGGKILTIYGKIVAEADRDIDCETVFRRTIQFGLSNYPQFDKEGHWKRFLEHMHSKYAKDGYLRLWIPNSPNATKLNELRAIIETPAKLREAFDRLFAEETAATT